MKSVNTWNLTNKKLHKLFNNNNEFISIKVRGNTWEPLTRWLRLDSRIFREITNKARINGVEYKEILPMMCSAFSISFLNSSFFCTDKLR